MIGRLRGRDLKARFSQPADEMWDRRLGVRTFGYHAGRGIWGEPDWASHYQPLSYRQIFAGLEAAGAGPDDVFADLGCGLGRAVFAAAHFGVARAVGVELVPELAAAAEANRRAGALAGHDIDIVAGDARDHPLGDTTLLYFFHALSAQIIAQVLARAREQRRGRFRLIYANPVFDDVVETSGWLRRTALLPPRRERFSAAPAYETTIWTADD